MAREKEGGVGTGPRVVVLSLVEGQHASLTRVPSRGLLTHVCWLGGVPPLCHHPQFLFRVGLMAGGALAAKRALAPYAQPAAQSLATYCGLRPAAGDDAQLAAERERLAAASEALEHKAEAVAASVEDVKTLLRRVERDMARPPPPSPPPTHAAGDVAAALTPAIKEALRDLRDQLRAEVRAALAEERAQGASTLAMQTTTERALVVDLFLSK